LEGISGDYTLPEVVGFLPDVATSYTFFKGIRMLFEFGQYLT